MLQEDGSLSSTSDQSQVGSSHVVATPGQACFGVGSYTHHVSRSPGAGAGSLRKRWGRFVPQCER